MFVVVGKGKSYEQYFSKVRLDDEQLVFLVEKTELNDILAKTDYLSNVQCRQVAGFLETFCLAPHLQGKFFRKDSRGVVDFINYTLLVLVKLKF